MAFLSTAYRFIAVAFLAAGVSGVAAEGASAKAEAKKADAKAAIRDSERKNRGASTADLKKLVEEASKQRDALIAGHEALVQQLKDATEEQKTAIREKMEAEKKRFDEVMASLHRQIRDEQRKERAAAAGKR